MVPLIVLMVEEGLVSGGPVEVVLKRANPSTGDGDGAALPGSA